MRNKGLKIQQNMTVKKASALIALLSIFSTHALNANVVGTNSQNFNSTSNSNDYVTVYSSKTIGFKNLGLGLFINAAQNSLPYFADEESASEDSGEGSKSEYSNLLVSAELGVTYGLLDDWDVSLSMPGVVYQHVKNDAPQHGEYDRRGVTQFRVGTKYQIWTNGMFGFAGAGSVNFDTTKNNPYAGTKPGPTYNTELVGDVDLGRTDFALNLGYQWKTPGKRSDEATLIEPYKNQYLGSIAASYEITDSTKAVAEIYGSSPSQKVTDKSNRSQDTSEAILGLKILSQDNLVYNVGMGSELRNSVASPDWRIYAGLNWTIPTGKPSEHASKAPEVLQEQPEEEAKPDQVLVMHEVFFEFDSEELRKTSEGTSFLEELAVSLRSKPYTKLVIEGHTCSLGTNSYNHRLSQRRASKIKRILIEQYQVEASKIEAQGIGEDRPIASNDDEPGREQNRRVEFKIFRDDAPQVTTVETESSTVEKE
jgi:outer membrane protein OmpA-like peptidoglycan-associated protein